ncbi:hypothetical protein N7527_005622 [Penicillium freii]|nr:hypothetical protein N7527_005622 [Penicillium freii]
MVHILRHGWSHPGRVPRLGTGRAVNAAMMAAYKCPSASSLSSSSAEASGPAASPSSTLSANPVAAPQGDPGVGSDLLSRFGFLDHTRNQDNAYEDLVEKLAIEDEAFSRSTTGPASPSPHQVEPDIVYVGDEHGLQSPCQQHPRDSTPFWR